MKNSFHPVSAQWGPYETSIRDWFDKCDKQRLINRLWQREPALWSKNPAAHKEIKNRLGWLSLPRTMRSHLTELKVFQDEVRQAGYGHAVLLGMGGSSLAPEVMQNILGNAPGFPQLLILDSTDPAKVKEGIERPEIEIARLRHYDQHDTYFFFDDPAQGRIRYREDEFLDERGNVTATRPRLTLVGQKSEGAFANEVLLSRSRFLAPATQTLRFYREYFKPVREVELTKDRYRWLIRYKDTEFFVNLDQVDKPSLGHFLEIKSRTWSRGDAQRKAELVNELLSLLGAAGQPTVTEDYIELAIA